MESQLDQKSESKAKMTGFDLLLSVLEIAATPRRRRTASM